MPWQKARAPELMYQNLHVNLFCMYMFSAELDVYCYVCVDESLSACPILIRGSILSMLAETAGHCLTSNLSVARTINV